MEVARKERKAVDVLQHHDPENGMFSYSGPVQRIQVVTSWLRMELRLLCRHGDLRTRVFNEAIANGSILKVKRRFRFLGLAQVGTGVLVIHNTLRLGSWSHVVEAAQSRKQVKTHTGIAKGLTASLRSIRLGVTVLLDCSRGQPGTCGV